MPTYDLKLYILGFQQPQCAIRTQASKCSAKSLKNFIAGKKRADFEVTIECVISEIGAGENYLIVNDSYFRM